MAGTLEQLVEEKNHNKNLANDKHKILVDLKKFIEAKLSPINCIPELGL